MKFGGRKRCGKCRSCGKTKKRFSHSSLDLRSTLPTTPAAAGPSSNTTFLLLPRIRPSMQREEPPAMETGLERIAARARCEPKLRFTSLAHHVSKERDWENLCQIYRLGSGCGWTNGAGGEGELRSLD